MGASHGQEGCVITEIAHLQIKPGQTAAFEAAFDQAKAIISASPGFIDLQLQRCIEDDHHYVLLVNWQTLEDHTVRFRQSEPYLRWKALLHHFYDPFPTVVHFEGC
jgi:heme-degrading monooxygenase HmoA